MKTPLRPDLLRAALALLLAAWLPAAQAFDLGTLMGLLAARKGAEARFTEERTVSSLDSPLRSSGTLSYTAPDRFVRQTLEPRPEAMEVAGNSVTLRRGGRTRTLQLDAVPELAALVDAMRGTLSGDAAVLQRHFKVELTGSNPKWVLLLTPTETRLRQQVSDIEIVGSGADVRSIDLRLAGGDRALMLIEPLPAPARK
ncbi:MAG: LolA-related protein [Rubrivivax sp.]